ncbi:hypothetical protein Agabi119p4_10490 [Agaricus bisporus var. burnettii]|uniref:YDG domain-containing protein n=1 Tax=Agaricus bisporus var. burnettii TaxID=192524 RepID=A0A8H7EWH6_AGABI|nr:hypothetical protein Agabi119p4_10490 [Agaricus bisporus var. burnettii]
MSSGPGQRFSLIRREIKASRGGSDATRRSESAATRQGFLTIGPKKRPPREGYYGPPKCPVGTMFASRKECSEAGVHFPLVAGISGSTSSTRRDANPGAFSIVLSGGYEDDVDDGNTILYTGAGGQTNTFSKTNSQVENQDIKHHFNHALRLNLYSGNPVRVVRGFKSESRWAPSEGYRYDGLYKVAGAKIKLGKSGHQVCLFRLERLPDQQPLEELQSHLP